MQFSDLTPANVRELLEIYHERFGIEPHDMQNFFELFKNKRYCIRIFLKDAKEVKSFNIDKTGFGAIAAWLTLDDVEKTKKC